MDRQRERVRRVRRGIKRALAIMDVPETVNAVPLAVHRAEEAVDKAERKLRRRDLVHKRREVRRELLLDRALVAHPHAVEQRFPELVPLEVAPFALLRQVHRELLERLVAVLFLYKRKADRVSRML